MKYLNIFRKVKVKMLKIFVKIILFPIFISAQEFYTNGFYKYITKNSVKDKPDLYRITTILEGDDMRIDISEVKKSLSDKTNLADIPCGIRIMSKSLIISFSGILIEIEKDKKNINPFRTSCQNIYVVENNDDRIFIEAFWNLENETQGFSEKIIKYKTIPDWWIFLKIESPLPLRKLTFLGVTLAWWGSPYSPFNMLALNKSGEYEMKDFSKNLPKSEEGDFALCFYNVSTNVRNRRFKKFIVFSEKNIDYVTFDKYGRLLVIPKTNSREITIAFGFYLEDSDFSNEKQMMIINDFFKNRAKEIKNKLESIDWTPIYEGEEDVEKLFKEIEKYSKNEVLKTFLEEYKFEAIKQELETSIQKRDYRKIIDIEENLKQMKEKMYEILIEDLKK